MGWPYQFVQLSPEQVEARRHILNKYGLVAQASAVAVILVVAAYQGIFNRHHASAAYVPVPTDSAAAGEAIELTSGRQAEGGEDLQHPDRFDDPLDGDEDGLVDPLGPESDAVGKAAPNEAQGGRLATWLDTPLRSGWKETRRHGIAAVLWACWIGSLAVRETGNDYLHLTKRFAQLAAALLPLHYLLGTPSPLSPLPRLFRVSSSSAYNPYHRFHAALILLLLGCHAGFYLNFYAWNGKLPGRLFDIDVILGLSMATTLTILAVLARQAIRYDPKRRRWFVGSHLIGAGVIPLLLFFHAAPAFWYAIEAAAVYGIVLVGRWWRMRSG